MQAINQVFNRIFTDFFFSVGSTSYGFNINPFNLSEELLKDEGNLVKP